MNENQLTAPAADLNGLNKLVGTWEIADPSGHDTIRGKVTYRWLEGRFFLLQEVDLWHQGQVIKGLEVIGHEQPYGREPSQEIKSRFYDSTGNTLDYVYEVAGDTLTIWAGEKGSPAYFKGVFSADGRSNVGAWVYPGGGGYASRMTRIE